MAGPKQAQWLSRTRRLTAIVLALAVLFSAGLPFAAGWLNRTGLAGLPLGFAAVAILCPLGLAIVAFFWQRAQAAIDDDLGTVGD